MPTEDSPASFSAPLRVDAALGPWPLHDAAASRQVETAALAAMAPHEAMERAGLAVARLVLALAPHARHVQLWCGPGNNGGDGLVAARWLHRAGKTVTAALVADATHLPVDAARALRDAVDAGVAVVPPTTVAAADGAGLAVVDALLGIGSRRPPSGELAAAIGSINAAGAGGATVVAVDLPSGLHPDTGTLLGEQAVRASATLALLTLKPGCHTGAGRDHAGNVWLDRLGFDVDAASAVAVLAGPPAPRQRLHATHKGSYGDVAVVGGAAAMTGAAVLAARAAIAAGAGRVHCSLLDDSAALPFDPLRPELMWRPRWWQLPPPQLSAATVACGCGGGDAVRAALPPLLAHCPRLVLDADAINALAADASLLRLLQQRRARGLATLLTPHPLEAARLLGTSAADVQRDRIAAARSLAERCAAAVLLKGSGSIVADGDAVSINPTGNAALATAGSGDVLAGWAAGSWAQAPHAAPAEVGAAAAWEHGAAADRWALARAGTALRASDLIEAMAAARSAPPCPDGAAA